MCSFEVVSSVDNVLVCAPSSTQEKTGIYLLCFDHVFVVFSVHEELRTGGLKPALISDLRAFLWFVSLPGWFIFPLVLGSVSMSPDV